jgi:hypothetical protein
MSDEAEAARDRFDGDKIRQWQFAILKFAVTLKAADEAAVAILARHLDRIGMGPARATSFFLRTSTEMCGAIVGRAGAGGRDTLRRFVSWIDEPQLKAAFVGALGIDQVDDGVVDSSADSSRGSRGFDCSGYAIVVQRNGNSAAWAWEICRNGKPLAVRLRDGGFKSESTAAASGKVALQDFLTHLTIEKAARQDQGL